MAARNRPSGLRIATVFLLASVVLYLVMLTAVEANDVDSSIDTGSPAVAIGFLLAYAIFTLSIVSIALLLAGRLIAKALRSWPWR